jgi:hypothetical protein
MAMLAESVDGVIGVDTHRDTLTAVAVTSLGGVLAQTTTSADAAGYQRLLGFARTHLPGRKSRRDAKRCLRRVIARQMFRLLQRYHQPGVEILRAA